MRIYLLGSFFVFIGGYHLFHTFFGYGMAIVDPTILSVGKDMLRIALVICLGIGKRKELVLFRNEWKTPIFLLFLLFFRAMGLSLFQGMSRGSIAVGMKYDIYPLVVLLSAIAVGFIFSKTKKNIFGDKRLTNILLVLLLGGLLWQGAKTLFPDFFNWFGYGPVGDYLLGSAPPIWYRTGPGGMMRLQGFFSGPNNYGFFLVGVSGLISGLVLKNPSQRKNLLLAFVYSISLCRTLSRGAWIGAGVAVFLTVYTFFPCYKKTLLGRGLLGIGGVIFLSLVKGGSTSGHRIALWEGISAFLAQPRGYGLGMAGPSVHYEGVYLPENQYMQILLDLGLPGLLLRGGVLGTILTKSQSHLRNTSHGSSLFVSLLLFGIYGLLIEGMFLHVWEDSMVNYLILGVFGFFAGQQSLTSLDEK